MVRLNVVDPSELFDQHLIAEYREIRLLVSMLRRTLNSKYGFQPKKVPSKYTLNKGHAYFFFPRMKYIQERYQKLREEMIDRGFNPQEEFPSKFWPESLHNNWTPTERDRNIARGRIKLRISERPGWYRYRGKYIK